MRFDLLSYIEKFMDRIDIPSEAKAEFIKVGEKIQDDKKISGTFFKCKTDFINKKISFGEVKDLIDPYAKELETSEYTLHFIFLINCTDILLEKFKNQGIDEEIFWDTIKDFRYKLMECHEVKGIWGTFVAEWMSGYMNMTRFALGRFQYEEVIYTGDTYKKNGIELNQGDKVYSFHIPSSGKPFDKPTRIASYQRAYEFFGFKEKGERIILVCNSWLLHKNLINILPQSSRVLDFAHDFDIVSSKDTERFEDAWRVFGKHYEKPLEQLPRDTSLRKVIAEYLLAGGKLGNGYGIIVFDGNKIINYDNGGDIS